MNVLHWEMLNKGILCNSVCWFVFLRRNLNEDLMDIKQTGLVNIIVLLLTELNGLSKRLVMTAHSFHICCLR